MPAPVTIAGLAPQTKPFQPAVIAIPGTKRLASRFSAQNRLASISAYVVPDSKSKIPNTLSVSVKRNSRLMALTLKGHEAQIIDLEFMQSAPSEPIFVLGSCDTDGVVYLWFLHIAKDSLGIDVALRLLKKYSIYSLRRSTAAYYTRIRLAGGPEDGTMVLVPNDGSNCRVVTFSCEAHQTEDATKAAAIEGPEAVPQLPAPEKVTKKDDAPVVKSDDSPVDVSRSADAAVATGVAAGAAAGVAVGAAVGAAAGAPSIPSIDEDATEMVIGEGLLGDDSAGVHEAVGTYERGTLVEDAEEEEYPDVVEHVVPPAEEDVDVYEEDEVETPTPGEQRGRTELLGEYEQEEHEEVIAEEVVDDEEEELEEEEEEEIEEEEEEEIEEEEEEEMEEEEEEEYEEYEEPEVERVYGEGLTNGHEPNYAPPY